jgi:hypothetical protein
LPEQQGVPDHPLESPLDLTVSSPAVLLNHIADRYVSTSRVLMEFIDNAFDDAESFFDAASNSYERPLRIQVLVDEESNGVRITDNCRGMSSEMLRRVTTHVGESKKRGQSFVNGQFGFGMQAFRACCRKLTVRSRSAPGTAPLEIEIDRDQSSGFLLREADGQDGHDMPETGTMVAMDGFDSDWASGDNALSVRMFAEEIEMHFERLLSRGNLEVAVVSGATGKRRVCNPVVYDGDDTVVVLNRTIDLGGGQMAQTMLVVGSLDTAEEMRRPARFFVKGRRIGKTSDIRSFFSGSKNRWKVWSNPQVMGYIDVLGVDGGPIQPVITRDEFKIVEGRKKAFAKIRRMCEKPMLEAIEKANSERNDKSLKGLEDALTSALSKISNKERKQRNQEGMDTTEPGEPGNARDPLSWSQPEEQEEEEELVRPRSKSKKQKQDRRQPAVLRLRPDDFRVKLVKGIPQSVNGEQLRSVLSGNEILVDVTHQDFRKRFKSSRSGAPKVDERVCGYLASVVSAHYRDASYSEFDESPESRMHAYHDMIGTYCLLEEKMRRALPLLQQEMAVIYATEG